MEQKEGATVGRRIGFLFPQLFLESSLRGFSFKAWKTTHFMSHNIAMQFSYDIKLRRQVLAVFFKEKTVILIFLELIPQ